MRRGYVVGPGDRPLRMIEREIDAGEEGRYLIQVAANADVIETQIERFEYALAATFLVLAVVLVPWLALVALGDWISARHGRLDGVLAGK